MTSTFRDLSGSRVLNGKEGKWKQGASSEAFVVTEAMALSWDLGGRCGGQQMHFRSIPRTW